MKLTDKARENLASGATTGAGTGYCSTCGGEKEDTRLNSRQCRTCAGVAPKVSRPDTVVLRTSVPDEVWTKAQARARADETTVAAVLRQALTDYAEQGSTTGMDSIPESESDHEANQ